MIVPGQLNVTDTGAFTYTIPIAVPPGTAGMVPALSLDYSSQNNNNGLVGAGWAISGLPSITRCPQTIKQDWVHGGINYDSNDRFCLNGQKLIAYSGGYGANGTYYRTELDGFTRVRSLGHVGTGPDHFLVWTKAGQTMEMGNSPDSKGALVPIACTYPQQTCPGNDPSTVRVWAVNKISDTAGNYLTITYNGGVQDTVFGEMYPTEIDYTGNSNAGVTPYNSVQFAYKIRTDQVPVYQAGYFTETRHLLTDIHTYAGSYAVSRYALAYNEANDSAHEDQLTSVTLCDHDSQNCLAPTTFAWEGGSVPDPTAVPSTLHGELHTINRSLSSSDYNNDGIVDATVLQEPGSQCPAGTQSAWYGSSDGHTFTASRIQANYGSNQTNQDCNGSTTFLQEPNTIVSDFDADGFTDILEHQYANNGSFTNYWYSLLNDEKGNLGSQQLIDLGSLTPQVADFFGTGQPAIYDQSDRAMWTNNGDGTFKSNGWSGDGIDNSDQTTLFAYDFDGDGCADLMAQGSQTAVFFMCNPVVSQLVKISGWDYYWHNGYHPTFADFNGDGKTDVLWVGSNNHVRLWFSTGTGFIEYNLDNTMNGISGDTIVTGDWNGDGKTDIALIPTSQQGTSNYTIQLSTGTGFIQGNGGAQINNPNGRDINAYAADWNSDGGPDIWLQFADDSGYDTEYLYPYTPLRIYKVWNGLGNSTSITYDRLNSGNVYTRTQQSSYPTQDVDGPVYVVSKITSGNGVGSAYASTYTYQDLMSDLRGRGMQGFAQMTVTDSQTGIVQKTTYHTDFPYTGLVDTQTKTCPASVCGTSADVIVSQTSNTYTYATTAGTADHEYYYDVEPKKTVVVSNDADNTPLPTVETDYNNYDGYGNPQEVVVTTAPPGASLNQWDAKKTTENSYNNYDSADNWMLGRLVSSTVAATYKDPNAGTSTITRSSSFAYGSGQILDEEIAEPAATTCNDISNPTNCFLKTDYKLDVFGHRQVTNVSAQGLQYGLARSTETDYDYTTTYHGQFPTTVTNNLGETETWDYDVKWGTPSSHTGPNGKTSSWWADTFGRPATERHVDLTYLKHGYAYCAGINGGSDPTCPNNGAFLVTITTLGTDNSTQIAPTKRIYYDSLSREIADDVHGFDGSWIRVDTLYNANGQVRKKSRPYFLSNPGSEVYEFYWAYDPLGRVLKVAHPDGSNTFYNYSGLTSSVIDQYGHTTTTIKNDLGQVQSVADPIGNTTTYAYDAYGELVHTIDPNGNMTTAVYDLRGHKLQSSDPDMGTWTYSYDGAGELLSQTDANGQTVAMQYDGLGRMTSRSEPDMHSTWTYGIAGVNQGTYPNSAGKLVVMSCTGSACGTNNAYERDYTYTEKLQPYTQTITQGTASYWSRPLYDSVSGRIATVRYFSGYTMDENYNATGYLSSITDDQSGFVIWQADTRDAELHLVESEVGGGIVKEWQSFDGYTGRIRNICATSNTGPCDGNLVNLSYDWNYIGNLTSRSDAFANNTNPEYFCYDADSRVTAYSVYGGTCTAGANYEVSYDALGNITAKTDINDASCVTNNTPCYLYGTTGAGPHAVSQIIPCSSCTVDGVVHGSNANFYYDANGNLNCVTTHPQCSTSASRSQTWTSFNMASTVTQGGTTISWTYDPAHQRASETENLGGTITNYADYPEIGVMAERVQTGGKLNWRNYIMADGHMVAIRTALSGQSPQMFYPVLDHLGSMAVLIDGNMLTLAGQNNPNYSLTITRYSYDAFGMARDPVNWTPLDCTKGPKPPFVRGFTGQEHLPDNVCLINFNARMYDEQIGRFISADPTIEAIYDGQDLNRYSYVLNNPLALTDSTGYGGFFESGLFRELASLAIVAVAPIALPAIGAELGFVTTSQVVADLTNAGIAGGMSGAVATGTLKGTLMGAGEAVAFAGLHFIKIDTLGFPEKTADYSIGQTVSSAAMHGMVGGLFSVGQKGGFKAGFIASGMSDLATTTDARDLNPTDFVKHAVVGGVGSVLGGGKFMNGAMTASFGYLFNDFATSWGGQGAAAGAVAGGITASGGCDIVTDGACVVATPGTYAAGSLVGASAVGALGYGLGWVVDRLFTDNAEVPDSVGPGPYAGPSVPAGPTPTPTKEQQQQINEAGEQNGCHTCGATTPGTKSGNWVGDHQPPKALGDPKAYYPQCLACSNRQGGLVRGIQQQQGGP